MTTMAQGPTTDARPARRGFTLLELLLTIAIVSLLVAILMPSLSAARRLGKRTLCASNLRDIARAWQVYLDDNGGRFLRTTNAAINYGGRQGNGPPQFAVPKPLNRYLNLDLVVPDGAEVFHCPSDEGGGGVVAGGSHFNYYGTSYRMNVNLVAQSLIVDPADPVAPVLYAISARLPTLTTPGGDASRVLMLGDFGWPNEASFSSTQRYPWHGDPRSYNMAFLDGHVDFVRIRKGLHVTELYTLIPFPDLLNWAANLQEEIP